MKQFFKEFNDFIMRGNVVDMAVGVIIGSAFTAIVNSLVNNIIYPIIACITGGGTNIYGLVIPGTAIDFGAFLSAIINFVIIAFFIFLMVKALNKLAAKSKDLGLMSHAAPKTKAHCPLCLEPIDAKAQYCPHCTQDIRSMDKVYK